MKTLATYLMLVVAVVVAWLDVLPQSASRIITSWIEVHR